MENGFIWLVILEIVIVAFVIIARIIIKKLEDKKVNKILNFIQKKSKDRYVKNKMKECMKIIEENSNTNVKN